jgi:hypothetical protein
MISMLGDVSFDDVLTLLISRICWFNLSNVLLEIRVHMCVRRSCWV